MIDQAIAESAAALAAALAETFEDHAEESARFNAVMINAPGCEAEGRYSGFGLSAARPEAPCKGRLNLAQQMAEKESNGQPSGMIL